MIWGTELPLFYDQAYYYYWSLHPDWGYFSKPPMVAWLIFVTTSLLGRIGTGGERRGHHPVLADRFVVHAIGRELYDERSGVWSRASRSPACRWSVSTRCSCPPMRR